MKPLETQFRESIQRIVRRWWLVRGLEITGAAIVAGSVVGLVLTPLFAWQGHSTWQLCAGVLVLSAVCGAILGFRRLPSPERAAQEADRQWKLDDLLGSAVGMISAKGREGVDPSMYHTLLQLAMHEVMTRGVQDLVFHRVRLRAWAGMGSLPVLLVLLTGICSQPAVLQAAADAKREWSSSLPRSIRSMTTDDRAGNQKSPQPNAEVLGRDGRSVSSGRDSRTAESASAAGDSAGRTRGTTDDARVPRSRPFSAAATSGNAGEQSGGNGASTSDHLGELLTGRVNTPRPAIPPWERTLWKHQQSAAIESLQRNPPPAEYRELIRDYFSR